VLAFSVVGLALLANVVSIALRSLPGPLRSYTNEPPLLLPMYLPFTWIIPVCVAGAFFGHVVVLRWALARHPAVA
jgi:hypothetical protein